MQIGTPREIYEEPVNAYVAARLGSPAINLVPRGVCPRGRRASRHGHHRRAHRARAHPQERERSRAPARVKWVEHLGDQNHLHVMIADTEVVTLCDRNAGLAVGDAVDIEFPAPLFFAASGDACAA